MARNVEDTRGYERVATPDWRASLPANGRQWARLFHVKHRLVASRSFYTMASVILSSGKLLITLGYWRCSIMWLMRAVPGAKG